MAGVMHQQRAGRAACVLHAHEHELGVHGAVGHAVEVVENRPGAAVVPELQPVVAKLEGATAGAQAGGEHGRRGLLHRAEDLLFDFLQVRRAGQVFLVFRLQKGRAGVGMGSGQQQHRNVEFLSNFAPQRFRYQVAEVHGDDGYTRVAGSQHQGLGEQPVVGAVGGPALAVGIAVHGHQRGRRDLHAGYPGFERRLRGGGMGGPYGQRGERREGSKLPLHSGSDYLTSGNLFTEAPLLSMP